jgi:UDP-N-acetylmuramate dehydrogenase
MWVEAGVPCAKVARMAALAGYTGVEFLAGIPGTMGGALAMNAGAFGGETWERVLQVETIDRQGTRRIRLANEYQVRYREVSGIMGEWFIAAELSLTPDPGKQGLERIKRLLAQRACTQPMGLPSCGSVFRNPRGQHAARLIERSGLKGYQVGAARVSERHANFIINLGQASAADIEAVIRQVQAAVWAIHGIYLTPEVKMLGEPAEINTNMRIQ